MAYLDRDAALKVVDKNLVAETAVLYCAAVSNLTNLVINIALFLSLLTAYRFENTSGTNIRGLGSGV